MSWTLQYIDAGGTTQNVTFAQLAALEGGKVVADAWQARFMSHKASTVSLRLPGVPPHIAPAIPFESRIKIIGPTGTVFQGLRTDRSGTANPRQSSSSYQFDDEWYFLDHCPFQQSWLRVTNAAGDTAIVPFINVVLYQPNPGQTYVPPAVNGSLIHTGQQIVDILNWAILQGANLQIGQIDPALYQAWYPVQNCKCGDAIRMCLRLHPDCFTEIDYATTPPTFHIRKRANLTTVLLPYAYTDSAGRRHTATEIQPRHELQPKRVALFYRVIADNYLLSTPVDIWPFANLSVQGPVITGQSVGGASAPYTVGGTPVKGTAMTGITLSTVATIPVGAPGGLRALDFSIDLQGPKLSISSAAISSTAFDPADKKWWRKKVPSLRQISEGGTIPNDGDAGALAFLSTSVNAGSVKDITVKDATTVDANGQPTHSTNLSTFGHELDPRSSPMSWMTASGGGPLQVIEVTVTAHFSYKQKRAGSSTDNVSSANDHTHSVRVKLCNSESISQKFTQYITTGEVIPPNLARNVYEALAVLQYSFTHSLVERPFNGWLKPGKHSINLDGGAPDWETMNATLQQSEYKMHLDGAGNTFDNFNVKCGPVEFLEPGQLVQIFNVFSNRDLTKVDANERLSGQPAPGNTVEMPNDAARENSVPGGADLSQHVLTDYLTPGDPTTSVAGQINHDAHLITTTLAATTPTPITGADATGIKTMQPRECKLCDDDGNVFYAIVHCTAGYTKPA